MPSPRFSILIPSRNRANLLRYAVRSVIEQDFADFEIVISDNASNERYEDVLNDFGDVRIRFLRSDEPLSVTRNWEAFHAIDQMPHSPSVRRLLRRAHGGVYARLSAIPDDPYKDVGPEPVAALLPEFDGPQHHFSEEAGH